jgi:hypothetical protein
MNPRVASFNRSRNQIQNNNGCEKALLPPHPSGDFNDAGRQAGQGNRRDQVVPIGKRPIDPITFSETATRIQTGVIQWTLRRKAGSIYCSQSSGP